MNSRVTARDRNAIKGALRRAFARSELHKSVIAAAVIQHSDPSRPRVKTWCRCNICKLPEARSYVVVDHLDPVIPLHTSFEEQGVQATIDRLWCDPANLQAVCGTCHDAKTKAEKELKKKLYPKPKKPRAPRKGKSCGKA